MTARKKVTGRGTRAPRPKSVPRKRTEADVFKLYAALMNSVLASRQRREERQAKLGLASEESAPKRRDTVRRLPLGEKR